MENDVEALLQSMRKARDIVGDYVWNGDELAGRRRSPREEALAAGIDWYKSTDPAYGYRAFSDHIPENLRIPPNDICR